MTYIFVDGGSRPNIDTYHAQQRYIKQLLHPSVATRRQLLWRLFKATYPWAYSDGRLFLAPIQPKCWKSKICPMNYWERLRNDWYLIFRVPRFFSLSIASSFRKSLTLKWFILNEHFYLNLKNIFCHVLLLLNAFKWNIIWIKYKFCNLNF